MQSRGFLCTQGLIFAFDGCPEEKKLMEKVEFMLYFGSWRGSVPSIKK